MEIKEKKGEKTYIKKPTLNSRVGRYLLAQKTGKTKEESRDIAKYSHTTHPQTIEQTKSYQQLEERYYKDELLDKITLSEIAKEHIKNIKQDKDRGAKNTAIKMAKEYIEPETEIPEEKEEVLVVLTTQSGGNQK